MASRAVLLLGAGLLLLAVSVSGLRRESVVAKGKEALLVRQQNPEGRFDFAHPTKKKKTCAVGCNATADWTCKSGTCGTFVIGQQVLAGMLLGRAWPTCSLPPHATCF